MRGTRSVSLRREILGVLGQLHDHRGPWRAGALLPRREPAMRILREGKRREPPAWWVPAARLSSLGVDWLAQPICEIWHKIVSAVLHELFQLCFSGCAGLASNRFSRVGALDGARATQAAIFGQRPLTDPCCNCATVFNCFLAQARDLGIDGPPVRQGRTDLHARHGA
jgi:hypothetical protein